MIKKKTVKKMNSADPIFYMHGGHVWLWEEGALDNSWHATHIIPLSQSLSLSIPDSSFTFLQHSSRISWCRQYRPHSCREKQRESVYVCGRKSKTAFFCDGKGFSAPNHSSPQTKQYIVQSSIQRFSREQPVTLPEEIKHLKNDVWLLASLFHASRW